MYAIRSYYDLDDDVEDLPDHQRRQTERGFVQQQQADVTGIIDWYVIDYTFPKDGGAVGNIGLGVKIVITSYSIHYTKLYEPW